MEKSQRGNETNSRKLGEMMISEVENILKGRVESTVEFDTSKKIIGISQSNLTAGDDGIAPLSKQNAFTFKENASASVETLDLSDNNQTSAQTSSPQTVVDPNVSELKTPVVSDIAVDVPLEVNSPKELSNLSVSAPSELAQKSDTPTTNDIANSTIDIQMPQMPETILAQEPVEVNEKLFEVPTINESVETKKQLDTSMASEEAIQMPQTTIESTQEKTEAMQPNAQQTIQEPAIEQVKFQNINVQNSDISKSIKENINNLSEERLNKLLNNISSMIREYIKKEVEEKYQTTNVNEPSQNIPPIDNSVMNDALAQINNIVVPTQNGPKL